MTENTLHPVIKADPLIEDAVKRAFTDLATKYFDKASDDASANLALREQMLREVDELGFCDALPDYRDADAWPDAAAIIRAQAGAAMPIDMVAVLIHNDRTAAIESEAAVYEAIGPRARAETSKISDANLLTALGRCLQITTGMEAAVDLSLQYVQDRKQFGRPLSAFQVIQHSLAVAAEEVAAATAVTDCALACMTTSGLDARFESLLRAAYLVNSDAVTQVFEVTHQVHGAIGFTREYMLHRQTMNLLTWRDELQSLIGGETQCAEELGLASVQHGGVWPAITALMGSSAPDRSCFACVTRIYQLPESRQ